MIHVFVEVAKRRNGVINLNNIKRKLSSESFYTNSTLILLIECAVHPENKMHSKVIKEAILERLQ